MPEVKLIEDKKPKTLGQFLARMLRTAVVECQAVEAGRHPRYKLDMASFGVPRLMRAVEGKLRPAHVTDPGAEENICGCLGGIYAMLGCGLPAYEDHSKAFRLLTKREEMLDNLRRGDLPILEEFTCGAKSGGDEKLVEALMKLKPIPHELAQKVTRLIKKNVIVRAGLTERDGWRADWNTYLKAAELLESYS